PVHDAERREKLADPGLGGEQQGLEWVPVLQESERRDGEQNVAERSRMDGERQGERSARAASWSRPFVASAVPEQIVARPSRSVDHPPASSTTIFGAGRAQASLSRY